VKRRKFDAPRILTPSATILAKRRQVLQWLTAAGGTALLPTVSGFRANADTAGTALGPGGIPLSRPDHPVTLPLHEEPIADALKPETGGSFRVFNAAEFIDQELLRAFGEEYGVTVELTTFDSSDQVLPRLATKSIPFDVTEITPNNLGRAVAGKLLKPLNHSYLPNLKENVWPSLHSPFYDTGSQYSVPYTVYATGIGWRSDKVAEDVPALPNPWSIFWNAQRYNGYVGVLSDAREALALAMLYRGVLDINTEDPTVIDRAAQDLIELTEICNPKVNTTQYQTLATGESWLHQAWSGDLLGAYLAFRPEGDDGSNLRFWSAPKGKGPIQNDCWAICTTSTKPVLAHLFLNYMLARDVAYNNFVNFTGYQPPQVSITPDSMVSSGVIPPNLSNTIFTSDDSGPGSIQLMALTVDGQKRWQDGYSRFVAGG